MSRGKQGIFTIVAALATVATMAVAPAFAVTISGSVAATDERAPDPVANVQAFLGADGIEVSWELSPSDFVRQSPTGTDFTSAGTFVNVNDVVGYNVWRAEGSLAAELAGTVMPGETIVTDIWKESDTEMILSARVKEREVEVVKNARATIR